MKSINNSISNNLMCYYLNHDFDFKFSLESPNIKFIDLYYNQFNYMIDNPNYERIKKHIIFDEKKDIINNNNLNCSSNILTADVFFKSSSKTSNIDVFKKNMVNILNPMLSGSFNIYAKSVENNILQTNYFIKNLNSREWLQSILECAATKIKAR